MFKDKLCVLCVEVMMLVGFGEVLFLEYIFEEYFFVMSVDILKKSINTDY